MACHITVFIVFIILTSFLCTQSAPPVRFEYPEELKEKHPGKRALLVPHILPFSNGDQNQNMKDELIILGTAAAIIRSNRYDELSILEKYTEINKVYPVEAHHLKTLTDFARSASSKTKIRMALVDSNHTWQYWQDAVFQQYSRQYDSVFFIGADTVDGQHSCANAHHRLRLMYVAAKGAHTVVTGVNFNRRRIDRCAPTLRFLRALLESNVNIWAVQDSGSLRDIQSIPAPEKLLATKLVLAADPALLSPHLPGLTKNIEDVVNRIEIDKLVARRLIGVNIGSQMGRKMDAEQLLQGVATAICHLHNSVEADTGISIIYVPHDYSHDNADIRAAVLFQETIL